MNTVWKCCTWRVAVTWEFIFWTSRINIQKKRRWQFRVLTIFSTLRAVGERRIADSFFKVYTIYREACEISRTSQKFQSVNLTTCYIVIIFSCASKNWWKLDFPREQKRSFYTSISSGNCEIQIKSSNLFEDVKINITTIAIWQILLLFHRIKTVKFIRVLLVHYKNVSIVVILFSHNKSHLITTAQK